jgi:hypothetical protein
MTRGAFFGDTVPYPAPRPLELTGTAHLPRTVPHATDDLGDVVVSPVSGWTPTASRSLVAGQPGVDSSTVPGR